MASSKTRNAATFLADRFENILKNMNIRYNRIEHRTDGIAFYFTRIGFIRDHDWTIRISDHEQQGDHKYKKNYYSIAYRDLNKAIPNRSLEKAVEILRRA